MTNNNNKARSFRTDSFNKAFSHLPKEIQNQATEVFKKWQLDQSSLSMKPLNVTNGLVWSAEINSRYRTLAIRDKDNEGKACYIWFWAGSHEDYNNLLGQLKKTLPNQLAKARARYLKASTSVNDNHNNHNQKNRA